MKVNGRLLPNHPKQAYMLGKLHGAQSTMGNAAMVRANLPEWCGVSKTTMAQLMDCVAV